MVEYCAYIKTDAIYKKLDGLSTVVSKAASEYGLSEKSLKTILSLLAVAFEIILAAGVFVFGYRVGTTIGKLIKKVRM